jgi:hypothetical protein
MTNATINISASTSSLEWIAAMYESMSADDDYVTAYNAMNRSDTHDVTAEYAMTSASGYADAAMKIAEELEISDLERAAEEH